MENENAEKQLLREALRKEVARLLCSDELSEEEKFARIKRAQEIIERGAE